MAAPAGAPPAAPPAGAPPPAAPVGAPPAVAKTMSLPGVGVVTQQPDGTWKAASGLILVPDGNGGIKPDPTSLAQVAAAAKAQSQPGGLTTQGETFSVNADGTLTITGRIDGKPLPSAGNIVQPNGAITGPDGTQVGWAIRTPSGAPATDNPNFKGDNGGFVNDLVTKDNPIAGTYNAAVDVGNGQYKKAASDFGAGTSGGTLPQVDADGNIVPGDTTKTVATEAGLPADIPGVTSPVTGPGGISDQLGGILSGLGLGGGGGGIDTSAAGNETARANALADALGGQAGTAGGNAAYDRSLGLQTRDQQQQSIAGLQDAANGTAPSAAELQLKQQAGIDAARQYGLAAALQGNNPGAALRQASLGAAQIAGTTNQNAGVLRANEQATARGQLASTLAGVRQGDQSQGTADLGQQGTLTGAQVASQGQGVTSTGQQLTAKTEEDKAKAQEVAAGIGAGGTLLSGLLSKSDKRAKKNIAKSDLADALAKGVHGVSFTYRPEAEEDDTPHFGILADELEKVIPGVVRKGASGFKEVHTGHLALANVGVTAELARRLQKLEKARRSP